MQRKFVSFKHILFPDTGWVVSGNMFLISYTILNKENNLGRLNSKLAKLII